MKENVCKVCGAIFNSRQELEHHNESTHVAGRKGGEEVKKQPPKSEPHPM